MEIADIIAGARVGGNFWGANTAPDRRGPITVIRPSSIQEARTLAARWREAGTDVLAVPAWNRRIPARDDRRFGVSWFAADSDPWPLIEKAERIIARPDDEFALLAAIVNTPVFDPVTSLPIDRKDALDRLGERLNSFAYSDPFYGHPIGIGEWIEILGDWRRQIDTNRRIGPIVGIATWKRAAISRLLWAGRPATFVRLADPLGGVRAGETIALWPSRAPADLPSRAAAAKVSVARIEDGFVRSIGLGTHLHPPRSIVVDLEGIHYDPRRPSNLESLLAEHDFSSRLIERAAALIQSLTRSGITKYAAGVGTAIVLPQARRRVLVTGQVEDDLSVRHGGAGVTGNLDLLRRVRAAEPDAYIAYKPHPDVAEGLRKGQVTSREVLRFADIILPNCNMATLFSQVDAVHVLTSLAGFEALLRGCEVVTHGQPFYAGWGLTTDKAPPIERRRRRLTLEQLVAGALILYPRYLDPVTGLPCPPEVLMDRHAATPDRRRSPLNWLRMMQGRLSIGRSAFNGAPA